MWEYSEKECGFLCFYTCFKNWFLQQNSLLYQMFVLVLDLVYVYLGVAVNDQSNIFLCTIFMPFCTQGAFLQVFLTFFLTSESAVQRAVMERWEAGGECPYAAVGVLSRTASGFRRLFQRIFLPRGNQCQGIHLNNIKLEAGIIWYPHCWSLVTGSNPTSATTQKERRGHCTAEVQKRCHGIAAFSAVVPETRMPSLDLEFAMLP